MSQSVILCEGNTDFSLLQKKDIKWSNYSLIRSEFEFLKDL